MRINASQKGTNIASRHSFDPGASQLRRQYYATETWLYAVGARVWGQPPQIIKQKELIINNSLHFTPAPYRKKILFAAMHYG